MRNIVSAILGVTLFAPASASAVDFYEKRGGWDIVGTEKTCGMSMTYDGPGSTALHLLMNEDESHSLTLTNYNWSIENRELYELTFQIDEVSFESVNVAGIRLEYKPGFLALAEDNFVQHITKGKSLYIYLGDKLVDHLSLKGTAVAVKSLRKCRRALIAEIAVKKKEEERWAHLSDDPFAQAKPTLPKGPQAPKPINQSYWVRSFDYPSKAIREGRQGAVGFEVEVSKEGRVTLCRISSTSGHPDLDEAACRLVTRRGRFSPATDADGMPKEGTFSSSIRWNIPEPEPEPPEPVYIPAQ